MITYPGIEADSSMAYETYFALRRYFEPGSKYDYFKYNGKILKQSVKDNFRNAREFRNGLVLYNRYKTKAEIERAVVSTLIKNPDTYIIDISYDDYLDLKRRYETILYVFEEDLKKIFGRTRYDSPKDYFIHNNDYEYSIIYDLFVDDQICIETVVILECITMFLSKLRGNIIDFSFEEEIIKIIKYKNFFTKWVTFDILVFKKILKGVLNQFYHE